MGLILGDGEGVFGWGLIDFGEDVGVVARAVDI